MYGERDAANSAGSSEDFAALEDFIRARRLGVVLSEGVVTRAVAFLLHTAKVTGSIPLAPAGVVKSESPDARSENPPA